MIRARIPRAAAAGLRAVVVCALCVGACGDERSGFERREWAFNPDASVDAGDCGRQCSLDGRSVVERCTNEVVERCPAELACGAGLCQDPCAAVAADRSSNGCEFYLQPPRFTKAFTQSCYAAFIVNTSTLPVEVSLELEGQALDISKSMYRTTPGDATLTQHAGPIPPGESAILFVSDRERDAPISITPISDEYASCPDGVVPASYTDSVPDGTGIGASFHLTTSVPIALSTIYPFGGATSVVPGATLLLPVATWAKEHVLINAWEGFDNLYYPAWPGAQIVASEDDTDVTIRPTHDVQDGHDIRGTPAKVPASYRLQKGQHLQLLQFEELTGSIVSSNKPTSIFGGHACAFIPSTRPACDVMAQQIPAFEQWGSEYVGVGYRPRIGNEHEPMVYRIVAAKDGTLLDYDPAVPHGAPITMSAGEVVTFTSGTGDAFVVRSQDIDHPVYLAAYMPGGGNGFVEDMVGSVDFFGHGDPEFVNVVPAGQYLNSYSFYADPTYEETSLVVIRAKANGRFEDVWLECAGDLVDFKPIGTRGDYEFVRVDLSRRGGPGQAFGDRLCRNGLQRMRSEGPFTATLWGWSDYASYAFPGGMAQRKLVATPLLPIR